MTTSAFKQSGLSDALRIAEEMRGEIQARVGLSGMRLRIFRRGLPLEIGLDDARTEQDAVLDLTITDAAGEIASVLVRSEARAAFGPEEARTIGEIVQGYASRLRGWLTETRSL